MQERLVDETSWWMLQALDCVNDLIDELDGGDGLLYSHLDMFVTTAVLVPTGRIS